MLLDRPNWPSHRPWLIVCVLLAAAALAWFVAEGHDAAEWPGGSSVPGFTFGVCGGLIILFECVLWIRKKVRVWPIGSARTWLRAHIWLGLLCLPLLILHSGLRLGGPLSTVLMALLVLVIASGVWGLFLQNVLPRRMLDMSAETVYTQRDFLASQLLAEAVRLVSATSGAKAEDLDSPGSGEINPVVVGAVAFRGERAPAAPVPESELLAVFYRTQVAPFLRRGKSGDSSLASASQAAVVFQTFRTQLPPAAHATLDALERFCQQRRLWDSQARWHFWLHSWLWVHFPLSAALLVLMMAHIFVALKYW